MRGTLIRCGGKAHLYGDARKYLLIKYKSKLNRENCSDERFLCGRSSRGCKKILLGSGISLREPGAIDRARGTSAIDRSWIQTPRMNVNSSARRCHSRYSYSRYRWGGKNALDAKTKRQVNARVMSRRLGLRRGSPLETPLIKQETRR